MSWERYEEVYPPELLDKLHAFYNGHENWKELLYQYPPDIIICEKSDKLYSLLSDETDWIKVYQGYFGGVFIRKDNMKSSFLIPPNNIYYYRKTLFDR